MDTKLKTLLFTSVLLFGFFIIKPAVAQSVRIIAIDGQLDATGQTREILVQPGQTVSLVADEVWYDASGSMEYAYREVSDFIWTSNVAPGDRCDASTQCGSVSNFETTEYGVNFYVPWNLPSRVVISVRARWSSDTDSIVLINERISNRVTHYSDLDGLGRWVVISGDRVFVPYGVATDWSPYSRGYWYWTSYGWTWYSYDPWGYMTDHFGHWRHSRLYGWVWIPDPLWVWRPAVVSFYYGPSWIGWYPYDPGWTWGYRKGYAHGYNDGYWDGYRAGRRDSRDYRRGRVMVGYDDFYRDGRRGPPPRGDRSDRRRNQPRSHDISEVRVRDTALIDREFNAAHTRGDVSQIPGGSKDVLSSRNFIAQRGGHDIREVKLDRVSVSGTNAARMQPKKALFDTPKSYVDARATTIRQVKSNQMKVTAPVGRSVGASKAVAPAPVRLDTTSRAAATWQPKSMGGAVNPGVVRPSASSVGGTQGVSRDSMGTTIQRVNPSVTRPAPTTVSPSVTRPVPTTTRTMPNVGVRPSDVRTPKVDRVAPTLERRPVTPSQSQQSTTSTPSQDVLKQRRMQQNTDRLRRNVPAAPKTTPDPRQPSSSYQAPNRAYGS